MAQTGQLTKASAARAVFSPVTLLRIAIVLGVLAVWEFLAHSGWLYRDVVPSLIAIGGAIYGLLSRPNYYFNLGVTVYEIGCALAIGGISGVVVGLLLGPVLEQPGDVLAVRLELLDGSSVHAGHAIEDF